MSVYSQLGRAASSPLRPETPETTGGPPVDILTTLLALCFLMFVAYRGYSVILFAPIAVFSVLAIGAIFLRSSPFTQT